MTGYYIHITEENVTHLRFFRNEAQAAQQIDKWYRDTDGRVATVVGPQQVAK